MEVTTKCDEQIQYALRVIGAGANVREFRLKAPCLNPCQGCAIAGRSFLTPKNECVPRHMCVKLPDCAQCQLQSFQLFLVSCRFTVSFPGVGHICARLPHCSAAVGEKGEREPRLPHCNGGGRIVRRPRAIPVAAPALQCREGARLRLSCPPGCGTAAVAWGRTSATGERSERGPRPPSLRRQRERSASSAPSPPERRLWRNGRAHIAHSPSLRRQHLFADLRWRVERRRRKGYWTGRSDRDGCDS